MNNVNGNQCLYRVEWYLTSTSIWGSYFIIRGWRDFFNLEKGSLNWAYSWRWYIGTTPAFDRCGITKVDWWRVGCGYRRIVVPARCKCMEQCAFQLWVPRNEEGRWALGRNRDRRAAWTTTSAHLGCWWWCRCIHPGGPCERCRSDASDGRSCGLTPLKFYRWRDARTYPPSSSNFVPIAS